MSTPRPGPLALVLTLLTLAAGACGPGDPAPSDPDAAAASAPGTPEAGAVGPAVDPSDPGIGLPLGTPAPAAALADLEGNPVDLLDYVEAGKPTLIEIWASWCENCEALQPQMDRVAAEYGDRVNVVAVAVAVAQSQRRVLRHVEEHGATYPYLWDGEGEVVRNYNAATTSIVMILDGEGRVAYAGAGGDQDLVGAIEAVLEG